MAALEHTVNLPNNVRFRNTWPHRYPLRSLTNRNTCNHIYSVTGKKQSIDALLKGDSKETWTISLSNEWGRLAQGNSRVKGTSTIRFIKKNAIPLGRDVTYATFVCDYKPLKKEKHRVRITVGGDRLTCMDDTGSPTANLVEIKLLLNSVISDAHLGARFVSIDLQNFFLATPMNRKEYMRVKLKHLPDDIVLQYDLRSIATSDDWVYIEIQKGMYGLKNAAILAYQNLKNVLEPFGYRPIVGTVGMWKHDTRKTRFCVTVDDFGVKCFCDSELNHLLKALNSAYKCTIDYKGEDYCGLHLAWNYDAGYVDISMPNYINKSLDRLQYKAHTRPQFSPHVHIPPKYGEKGKQQPATPSTSLLHFHQKKRRKSNRLLALPYTTDGQSTVPSYPH